MLVISVHLAKAGGTSFRKILEGIYGDKFIPDYDKQPIVAPREGCIHGHFNPDKYWHEIKERRAELITWVRDPVERAISTYYFLRSHDAHPVEKQPPWERAAKTLSLEEYLALGYSRNEGTRQLRGISVERFTCVGVMEMYQESLEAMRVALDWPELPSEVPHLRRQAKPEVPDDLQQLIRKRNYLDQAFYDAAVDRLQYQLEALGNPDGRRVFGIPDYDYSGGYADHLGW